ncbi:MAG: DISARM system phospholipase D-like protein DrmC [Actinomycetota bacterium]|nr:DISARM system phospholipase D-like protein DrmC [Actinomycetota bacterium]
MIEDVATIAALLAERLPAADLQRLAEAAGRGLTGLGELRASAANPSLRDACNDLADSWRHEGELQPGWVSGALAGAATAAARMRHHRLVDVVWTGPESDVDTSRLTAPTVAELIDAARSEIWLVSFATRNDQGIADALAAALRRNVEINALVERHADNPAYSSGATAFSGLDLRRLVWPAVARPAGAALHAKLIVVDRSIALVGSANLTGRAMTDNLECGVLLRGGPEPSAIVAHLEGLVRCKVLRPA